MLKRVSFIAILLFTVNASSQTYAPGQCRQIPDSKTCIDQMPCKTTSKGDTVCLQDATIPIGALTVAQSCWQYSYKYACVDPGTNVDTCKPLSSNPACSMQKTDCISKTAESGACNQWQYTYSCQTKAPQQTTQLICSNGALSGGPQIPANSKANQSFSKAALAMEIARQASVYGEGGNNMFAGVSESCKTGYFGIKDCCKSSPGAKSNSQAMSLALSGAFSVSKYAGAKAIDTVSPYVFDTMYKSNQFTAGMASSIAATGNSSIVQNSEHLVTGTNFASNGLTLSAYGFTYGTGAASAAGSGFMNASQTLWGSQAGSGYVTFNPYIFAANVAIQIITDLASCSADEQLLALHRGANLSVFIRQFCSNKIPILDTCIEWTSEYCSYNSILAKIIDTQGKIQMGRSLFDCAGLTIEDVSKIDFSKIDFSEFTQSMLNQAKNNDPSDIKGSYQKTYEGNLFKGSAQGNNSANPTMQGK